MIHLSMLQLEDFWLDEFKIQSPQSNVRDAGNTVPLNISLQFQKEHSQADPRAFRGILCMHIKANDVPAAKETPEIRVKVIGEFRIHPKAPENVIKNYENLSAPSILYGICRGIVASSMAISTSGKMVIPSIDLRFLNEDETIMPGTPAKSSTRAEKKTGTRKKNQSRS